MRLHHRYTESPTADREDWRNFRLFLPYLWRYRWRVGVAMGCLILAKLANVGVPLILKQIVDGLGGEDVVLYLPLFLLIAYGALRAANSLFQELRDVVFARVRHGAMRHISLRVMEHLHRQSLRFHLERKTGGLTRDIERGTQSFSTLLNYLVFSLLPIATEFTLVAAILFSQYDPMFVVIAFATVVVYVIYTLLVTRWRMQFRQRMNRIDSEANTQAIDSLINYETVKYFNSERLEMARYRDSLNHWEDAAVKTQSSMSLLNVGQALIIAVGVTLIMIRAAQGVVTGEMTVGDLVLVNAFLLQLFLPLGFLGIVYSQLQHALTDMDRMVRLLGQQPEIEDAADASELRVPRGEIRFERVDFGYQDNRQILFDVDFRVPSGARVAVVGPSGAGKSSLARLLFRFYDVERGRILIDGQDIRQVTQESLRRQIGIVPQDTVLFNESIYFNLAYAQPDASREEIERAARMAQIHDFIQGLPEGYDTVVGERGLKLSGGEKQRVAIARVILKNPPILVFDEATSSLDSRSERQIQQAMDELAAQRTSIVIAHRLSTIIEADTILVMDQGRIVEQGRHGELLAASGLYAQMWQLQQQEQIEQGGVGEALMEPV